MATEPDDHPAPIGRRRFLRGVGAVAGSAALAHVAPSGVAAAPPPGAGRFVPLPKAVRVIDTRQPDRYEFSSLVPPAARRHVRIRIAGAHGVPKDATAVVATATGVNWDRPNWVAAFPTRSGVPHVSALNMLIPFDVTANLVQVKLGADGAVELYSLAPCDVILDVLGYYEAVDGPVRDGRFVALPTAKRVIDTRSRRGRVTDDSTTTVDLTGFVPADASAAVINLTACECTGLGHFTVFADGEQMPVASNLNVTAPGAIRAAAVIVPVSTVAGRRRIQVFTRTAAEIIVDVTGYFTSPSSQESENGLFVALDPVRILDTRERGPQASDACVPAGRGRLWANWAVEGQVRGAGVPPEAATGAGAIVVNLTGTESNAAGFLTMAAARASVPPTSNLNFFHGGATVPNHVISPITSAHGYQVYASHGAHVIVDLMGYYTGRPASPIFGPYVNPAPQPIAPPWVLRVPRFGLVSQVLEGEANAVTNRGHSWHWTGTGWMGQDTHVATFAHRTDAGGPYRRLEWMEPGDPFTVTTLDGREYTYRMVRRDLTDGRTHNILAATRLHPGPTFSLIACTVGYDRSKSAYPNIWAPTSTRYRIVVTGELVCWREL